MAAVAIVLGLILAVIGLVIAVRSTEPSDIGGGVIIFVICLLGVAAVAASQGGAA